MSAQALEADVLLHVVDSSRADGGAAQRESVLGVLRRLGVPEGRLRLGLVEARNKADLRRAGGGGEEAEEAEGKEEEAAEASAAPPREEEERVRVGRGRGRGGRRGLYLPPFEVGVSAVTGEGLEVLGGAIESVAMLRGSDGAGCWRRTQREGEGAPLPLCAAPSALGNGGWGSEHLAPPPNPAQEEAGLPAVVKSTSGTSSVHPHKDGRRTKSRLRRRPSVPSKAISRQRCSSSRRLQLRAPPLILLQQRPSSTTRQDHRGGDALAAAAEAEVARAAAVSYPSPVKKRREAGGAV